MNFRCDGSLCQQSHTTGDTGGEFVLAMQSPLDWMSLEWVLPVGDLVNILSGMNYTIQVGQALNQPKRLLSNQWRVIQVWCRLSCLCSPCRRWT